MIAACRILSANREEPHLNTPEILTELTKSKIIVSSGRIFDRNTDKTDKNLKSSQLCLFQKITKYVAFICPHIFS
ncbi:hypothetical protein D1151_00525 [Emergencia sp. 1XD21-10]|nr:hypothetical protein [Emergencia sp. 1XD21-10]